MTSDRLIGLSGRSTSVSLDTCLIRKYTADRFYPESAQNIPKFGRQASCSVMGESHVDISGTVFDRMRLSDDTCFLCGAHFDGDKTREHVFPGWLQHRHNLWDQELTLLNGTTIRYSQLTIPCCKVCNTEHLSGLENRVRNAIENGYKEAVKLPPIVVYQWLGKIFYGILRKELKLLLNRRDGNDGTIVPAELLEGFSSLHLFLQSIRQPFVFPDGEPFSVLVVNLHHHDGEGDYFFRDSLQLMICSLRSKDVGFIVTLQDCGVIANSYGRYVSDVAGRKLIPIQFDELYAKCLYQMALFTRTPKFMTAANHDPNIPTSVHMLPIGGLSSKPVVEEWVQADYFQVLSAIMEQSYPEVDREHLFSPPSHVMTWMSDEQQKLILVDADGKRIPT